jgi:uncharacterized OB-fold protein
VAGEPIAEGLFTWPSEEPRLIGGRCGECDAVSFPRRHGCPRCGAVAVREELIGREGTLWTWTSQGFAPKEPFNGNVTVGAQHVPWFVGLVEIPGQLRLEALLVGVTAETIEIGMPMELVVVPWRVDDEGRETVTFAFTPSGATEVTHDSEGAGAGA